MQRKDESLKAYLTRFNKKCMITEDKDEKTTLVVLLGGVWLQSAFMAKLAKRTPMTLWEFMNQADNFINAKDTFRVQIKPMRKELGQVDRKGKAPPKKR